MQLTSKDRHSKLLALSPEVPRSIDSPPLRVELVLPASHHDLPYAACARLRNPAQMKDWCHTKEVAACAEACLDTATTPIFGRRMSKTRMSSLVGASESMVRRAAQA